MISETASDLAYRGHNRQVVFVSHEDYFYYQENLKEWKENLGISRTRETKEGKKINLSPLLLPVARAAPIPCRSGRTQHVPTDRRRLSWPRPRTSGSGL